MCSTQLSPTEKPLVTPQPGSSQQLQLKPCKTDDAAAAAPSVDDNAGNDDHEGTEDFDKFEDRGKSVDEGESIEDERTTIADDHQVKIMQPLLPLSPKAQNPLEKDVPKKVLAKVKEILRTSRKFTKLIFMTYVIEYVCWHLSIINRLICH